MSNEERKRKVTKAELRNWKLGFEHGDYAALAKKHNCHWKKYSLAIEESKATPTTIEQMNKFYASKKIPA
jgi:hypothetical protein